MLFRRIRVIRAPAFSGAPTYLLDALEADEAVTVADWQLSSRRVTVPVSLRPGKSGGKWWRVTPDGVIERTASPVVDRSPHSGLDSRQ